MNTDYIDIYLLHEPYPLVRSNAEDIVATLYRCIDQGKIRRWGLAYQKPMDHSWGRDLRPHVVQADGNINTLLDAQMLCDGSSQLITTRPFFGGPELWEGRMKEQFGSTYALHDLGFRQNDIPAVCLALARDLSGPTGSVVCSMFSPDHIAENARLMASDIHDDRIMRIVELLTMATRNSMG